MPPCRKEGRILIFGNRPALPLRGGDWYNGAGAGLFALYLNDPRANQNWNIGFRAALPSRPDARSLRAGVSAEGIKGSVSVPSEKGKKQKPHGSR